MSGGQDKGVTGLGALKQRALSLGAANAFNYAMQFLLPVLLVRFLPPEDFAKYRLLWLAIMTVMVVVPLNMSQMLYYFLPRSDAASKRLHVHMTLLYLGGAGLLGGLLISPWNALLPASMTTLAEYGALVPALVMLFAMTSLLDMLPTIDERVHWQAAIIIILSLTRTLSLGLAAWLSGDLRLVIWLLLALMLLKLLLLLTYIARSQGLGGRWFSQPAFVEQFRHAAPLGASTALYGLRGQADQWVAASLFALVNFAAFSIAAVLGPMVNLFRQSVNYVFLPSMSRLQAAGDMKGMVELNSQANAMVASLVFPLLAFAFVYAEEIVSLIYTGAYVAAAPVMRVYICGLLVFVVELSSLMMLMREGPFALRLNLTLLLASVAVSWLAAQHFGLAGAAMGSTAALYADRYATLRRIANATGIAFKHLQDWKALGSLLLIAALAGTLSWAVMRNSDGSSLRRLLLGGAIGAAAYGALWLARNQPLATAQQQIPP
jgi:O-antigen/teichoic acid export membrane protein